ncbi:Fur family transcriptional regulator, zinc uptake regulator [Epibacterium ulvae]|uniref:Fur family transcriptional regulator, zinc uptake regulator n=1 Tax=Epibacterium ulvae TaxID=1156985 RepID=A0A1G5PIU6_9RHOB|nr:Fur family transcriptional regulator [Epibacterium ulvae]SCZ49432.1 Fur family transcriptional regulator, zinc uptake regulator [Epibacterium ulvae]
MRTVSFEPHDHSRCIATTLETVAVLCIDKGLQFTPVRRRVLEILLEEHRAWGAYEILDRLREDGLGSQPPVAYRALDFLVKHSFAHRIERLNAFIACSHPGTDHAPLFMICRKCETVAEASAELHRGQLNDTARAAGFQIEGSIIEAEGVCPKCQGPVSQ